MSGPTAPPVITMLIACSIVRSVSITRSMGRICRNADVGLMAFGTSTAASGLPVRSVAHGAGQKANALLAGDREVHQHHALARSFFAIIVSSSCRTDV